MAMIDFLFWLIFRKDVDKMAMAYALLIIKGKKTYQQVPDRLKEQVKEILIDLDCGYLIEE
jgi:hypothetical protein